MMYMLTCQISLFHSWYFHTIISRFTYFHIVSSGHSTFSPTHLSYYNSEHIWVDFIFSHDRPLMAKKSISFPERISFPPQSHKVACPSLHVLSLLTKFTISYIMKIIHCLIKCAKLSDGSELCWVKEKMVKNIQSKRNSLHLFLYNISVLTFMTMSCKVRLEMCYFGLVMTCSNILLSLSQYFSWIFV